MSPFSRVFVVLLGLYLSLRGYHSLDGDQAYRLPLLLHHQDARVYADDPFVTAFDAFNPHRGAILILDAISRPLGLSLALFIVFVLMFTATCSGVDRLSRALWSGQGPLVGLVAVGLVLAAKAGNIGTNHLFEAMVLDRLVALALFWLALARAVARPSANQTGSITAIGLATWFHPSFGLQLALLLAASWIVWGLIPARSGVSRRFAAWNAIGLAVATAPGLVYNLQGGSNLVGDMPSEQFWLLAVELQSPQHMLPHLWRMPQWLAWGCYLALAGIAIVGAKRTPDAGESAPCSEVRLRLAAVLGVALAALAAGWAFIEVWQNVRVTVFQPFRLATAVRGIAIVFIAGRVVEHWRNRGSLGRLRAVVLSISFVGDWLLVVATLAELGATLVEAVLARFPGRYPALRSRGRQVITPAIVYLTMLAAGFWFLSRHDTESGQIPLLGAVVVGLAAGARGRRGRFSALRSRISERLLARPWTLAACAWIVPAAALLAGAAAIAHPALSRTSLVRGLVGRCRFVEAPVDDVERLALWCREHTPPEAQFIGPPGPKTFRLWSRRGLAFSRSGSPYHAAGLADWFERFQDHVDFHGTTEEFVDGYRSARHRFEARYQAQGEAALAALALRQGADFVIAAAPEDRRETSGSLELVHREGRYAVYTVPPRSLAQRQR